MRVPFAFGALRFDAPKPMGSRVSDQAQPLGGTVGFAGGLRGSGTGVPPIEPFVLRGNSYVVNFKPFFEGGTA